MSPTHNIEMKSMTISSHACQKSNVPAGRKSRVAKRDTPEINLVYAFMDKLFPIVKYKTYSNWRLLVCLQPVVGGVAVDN
jgi:hypothetical protein